MVRTEPGPTSTRFLRLFSPRLACRRGLRLLRWAGGGNYTGAWHLHLPHGKGVARSADGATSYDSEWKTGRLHGKGVLQFRDGGRAATFEGTFTAGRPAEGMLKIAGQNGGAVWRGRFRAPIFLPGRRWWKTL